MAMELTALCWRSICRSGIRPTCLLGSEVETFILLQEPFAPQLCRRSQSGVMYRLFLVHSRGIVACIDCIVVQLAVSQGSTARLMLHEDQGKSFLRQGANIFTLEKQFATVLNLFRVPDKRF